MSNNHYNTSSKHFSMQHDIHNFQTEYHQNYLTVDNGGVLPEPYSLPEVWVKVPAFLARDNKDYYEFSNHFRVRNSKRNKVLKKSISSGYILSSNMKVHILSAYFYLGTPPDEPDGDVMIVNHIDGNKQNPHPENLEYITKTANIQHGLTLPPLEPLTDEQVELVEALFLDGLTRSSVVEQTKFDYRQVAVIHRRLRATGDISDGYGLTPDEIDEVRELYRQGLSSYQIAGLLGVHNTTILKYCKDIPSIHKGLTDVQIEQIRTLYKSGITSPKIAKQFGVTDVAIRNHCKDIPSIHKGLTDVQIEQIRTLYKSGITSPKIAKQFGVDSTTVSRYCKDIPSQSILATGLPNEMVEQIRTLYKSGITSPKIAKQFGVDSTTVQKYCKDIPSQEKVNRKKIIDLHSTGNYTHSEIANIVGIHKNSVGRIIRKYREQNDQ